MEKIQEFAEYKGYTGYAFISEEEKAIVVQLDTEEADVSSNLMLTDNRDLTSAFKLTVDNFLKAKIKWEEDDRKYNFIKNNVRQEKK